jgi:hypothetical protein
MTTTNQIPGWRARLKRDLGWSVLVKLGLLTLMGFYFSSLSHRCRVDDPATASRWGLAATADAANGRVAPVSGAARCD